MLDHQLYYYCSFQHLKTIFTEKKIPELTWCTLLCRNNKTLVPCLPPHTPHLSTESFSSQQDAANKHILLRMSSCCIYTRTGGVEEWPRAEHYFQYKATLVACSTQSPLLSNDEVLLTQLIGCKSKPRK